jgi:hypothetical protein
MKKFLVLAMAATLLMAGSAFAVQRNISSTALVPTPELTFTNGFQPTSTNNNDTCDIGLTPAATLLLPYFEVETAGAAGTGATTLFTITNTSRFPQIAHVTVWTDWSFPVLDFNIFLTGYDVQGINLFDVIVRGIIVPGAPAGTSITTVPGSPQPAGSTIGATPANNTSNPNFILTGGRDVRASCAGLPGTIQADLANAIKNALTTGTGYVSTAASCGSTRIGFDHGTRAIGYVTADVVSYCSQQLPTDSGYYSGSAGAMLFDNTLIGDYQQIGPTPAGAGTAAAFDAQGNPMVHIRAVPEGGVSGAHTGGSVIVPTNLPFTFYDRYTGATPTWDRRQPLPSLFAARYIQGGTAGFATDYKIWREGLTGNTTVCGDYAANSSLLVTSFIRFDEHENSYGTGIANCVSPCGSVVTTLPETSRTATTAPIFPTLTGLDVGGWMYLNLSNQATSVIGTTASQVTAYTAARTGFGVVGTAVPPARGSRTTSQNWVIISMFGNVGTNRLSVDFDAAWLGNGCTNAEASGAVIAPQSQRTGPLVCPAPFTAGNNCGTGTLPPYVNP